MTGSVLLQRTFERLDEESNSPVYYTNGEVLSALNSAQRLFALLTLCLESTGPLPLTAATTHYRLLATFPRFLLPLRIRVQGGARLKHSRLADLDALSPTWQSAPGTAERYACLGFDLLAVYKQPASGGTTLDVTYARCPVDIDSASTPEVPEEYHPALIDGAIPFLRVKEGGQEFGKSLRNFARFLEDAAKLGQYVRARNLAERYDRLPVEIERVDLSKTVKAMRKQASAMLSIPQAAREA